MKAKKKPRSNRVASNDGLGGAPVKFDLDSLLFAFEYAADFLENEEWPHDKGEQEAAYREAAKRIRKMGKRFMKKPPNSLLDSSRKSS